MARPRWFWVRDEPRWCSWLEREREIKSLSLPVSSGKEGFEKYEKNKKIWLLYLLLNAAFRLPLKSRSVSPLAGRPTRISPLAFSFTRSPCATRIPGGGSFDLIGFY